MRLVAVSHSPWLGGAERCLLELVEELVRRPGVDVHVVLPGDGELRERLEAAGAPTSVVRARWWARDPGARRRWPAGLLATTREVRRLRADVVLSNTVVHPPGAVAAALLGVPHLWWLHEHGERDHGFRFLLGHRRTLRVVRALSDAVLVSAEPVRAAVEPVVGPVRTVPYAVAVPAVAAPVAPRPGGDPPRVVLCGRVRPSKGQADAVRAIARLDGVVLDVVGDGELDELRALAASLGVADRVEVHGAVADPLRLVDAADVALMCSRDEAFGRVTVEAMKRGRPVVGAAAGGTLDLVRDGETGLTYPPGDDAALAAAIARLLGDDALRTRVAAAGHADAVRRFSARGQADAVVAAAEAVAA